MNREQIYLMLVIERMRSGSRLGSDLCEQCWGDAGVVIDGARAAHEAEAEAADVAKVKATSFLGRYSGPLLNRLPPSFRSLQRVHRRNGDLPLHFQEMFQVGEFTPHGEGRPQRVLKRFILAQFRMGAEQNGHDIP